MAHRIVLLAMMLLWISGATAKPRGPADVALLLDGPAPMLQPFIARVEAEIKALLEAEVRITPARAGQWTRASVSAEFDRLLIDGEVDLIIGAGPIASSIMAAYGPLPKPCIALFFLKAEDEGAPREGVGSGVKNLVYLDSEWSLLKGFSRLRALMTVRKMAILVSAPVLEALPANAAKLKAASSTLGFTLQLVIVDQDLKTAVDTIEPDVDVVYLLPMPNLGDRAWDILPLIHARRLPTFGHIGRLAVEAGVMAGVGSDTDLTRLGRRVALYVERILGGEPAAKLPVSFPREDEQLYLNMRTARAVGFSPPFTALIEADLLHPEEGYTRRLGMQEAIKEALEMNLDLVTETRGIEAAAEAWRIARSRWLPSLNLNVTGTLIDSDRAEASMGSQAERALTIGATLNQVIFHEPLVANMAIQRAMQRSRELQREQLRLDVARDAATAYINVLRADTLLRIRAMKVKATRSNLHLARIRVAVGNTPRSDTLRWESQLANAQSGLALAVARSTQARTQLNRLLHRPQHERVEVATPDPKQLKLVPAELVPFVDNPAGFRIFQRYMVEASRRDSPELKALDALIAAKVRRGDSSSRAFYAPTLSLQAGVTRSLMEGGAGTDGGLFNTSEAPTEGCINTALCLGALLDMPKADDTDWHVAVVASLPLFEGGRRIHEADQAWAEVRALRAERAAAVEKLEQRVRSSLEALLGSYPNMSYTQHAAEAADESLKMVKQAYARGAVGISDLIDAHDRTFSARQAAADATLAFVADYIEVVRASGAPHLLTGDHAAWLEGLKALAEAQKNKEDLKGEAR